jgi:hypothetical protein
MSLRKVSDVHVDELYTRGATRIRGALTFVFSQDDEQRAVAAIAARLFDRRAVCRVVGPNQHEHCLFPRLPNGLIGLALTSDRATCAQCNNTIIESELPESTQHIFNAMRDASEIFESGDVVAFRGGPVLPPSTLTSYPRVWWHAPAYHDYYAAYVDPFWGDVTGSGRDPTTRAAVERRLADAPFECAFPRWEIEARTDVASEHPHPRQLQVPAPRPECLERPRSPVWG